MIKNIFGISLLVWAFLLFQNTVIAQSIPKDDNLPRVTLKRTEIRVLHSDIVGQDYELYISLPHSYKTSGAKYSVIFLLDPHRDFVMMKGYTDILMSSKIIQEVILVGIGYGGEGMNATLNYAVGRLRDYTPVQNTAKEEWLAKAIQNAGINDVSVISGGAPLFLEFIRKELFPFIELNYNIDNEKKVLSGYSDGGLFGLYVLFHDPDLFSKYLIGSPSINFNDEISLDYESNYAETHKDLKADIFMSSGALEEKTAENMTKMANLLNSRNYKNLKLNTNIFENENHSTSYPAFMNQGLKGLSENNNEK